jgi:hypothetical protein
MKLVGQVAQNVIHLYNFAYVTGCLFRLRDDVIIRSNNRILDNKRVGIYFNENMTETLDEEESSGQEGNHRFRHLRAGGRKSIQLIPRFND